MKRYNLISLMLLFSMQLLAQIETPEFNVITETSNAQIIEQEITSEDKFRSFKARGKYSVWYGCGEGGQPKDHIAKPFIWAEGINFPPHNDQKSHEPASRNMARNVYLPLLRDGFDIIQLDFENNLQWIQRNAELVITLIHQIQAEMLPG